MGGRGVAGGVIRGVIGCRRGNIGEARKYISKEGVEYSGEGSYRSHRLRIRGSACYDTQLTGVKSEWVRSGIDFFGMQIGLGIGARCPYLGGMFFLCFHFCLPILLLLSCLTVAHELMVFRFSE